ncbi:hypothetical protein A3749_09495 [Oleiphilus sp. HI0078]|nr:hypothetical protein A3743_20470 [Oleiphilus sp. HI0072]KZY87538.1 hypothetical protein A3743_14165 [Oleiphilus sp. HI0072]KZZ11208.1 hypothetical protein A3749_09495 [Oleiphilus sp. HI0078]
MIWLSQQSKENLASPRYVFDSLRPASRASPSRRLTPFFGVERSAKPEGANGSNIKHCASSRQSRESSDSADAGRVNLNGDERPATELFEEG